MASSEFASSSSSSSYSYHVFLSFRGEDVRNNFVSHLHRCLHVKGISAYKDDQELKRGRQISPELLTAIENSRFSIVVLSQNYASSAWCLEELVKMVECKNKVGLTVLPIFYGVDPSEVRKQTGVFGEALAKHERDLVEEAEKVRRWREALNLVANLSGWDSRAWSEAILIEEIAQYILNELNRTAMSKANDLFGIDSRIQELCCLLFGAGDDEVFAGIWGMGGIGKTTMAEALYAQISCQFECSCFLANVKEHGLVHLQEKLLSKILITENVHVDTPNAGANLIKERLHFRKVLVVLDDVDNLEQLEALAGKHNWFGSGSRIIITTRNEQLLIAHNATKIYKAKELEDHDAAELFCWKAFRGKHPPLDFVEVSKAVINYAKGLPLALKVLGSFLCGRSIVDWESALNKLKKCPNDQVMKILKISYDGLDDVQKNLFLDIACFFKGDDKNYVIKVLGGCETYPIDFSVLLERSLITIQDNRVLIHDLLQEMGRDIVRQESPEEPGKRSRLWSFEDVCHVFTKNSHVPQTSLMFQGVDVRSIILDLYGLKEVNFLAKTFEMMRNLRLLKVQAVRQPGGLEYLSRKELFGKASLKMINKPELFKDCKMHLVGDFKFLSNELRCLYWCGFPLKYLPKTFDPKNLVEFNMCYSNIKRLWKGFRLFEKLKFMKLSYSQNLTKTPDFRGLPNLERLILEGCTNLVEVHPSVGFLRRLILLNLKGCKNLKNLPSSIELESLEFFILFGCSRLKTFPEISNMPCLRELSLNGTAIKGLPFSIKHLTSLVELDLEGCKNLESLPSSICTLGSLETLSLSGCSRLETFPEISNMPCLRELFLYGTAIKGLPFSIKHLTGLVELDLEDCENLESLPCSICTLGSLETLNLSGCSKLDKLPENIGNLQCLKRLYADKTAITHPPPSIALLKNLDWLSFYGLGQVGFKSRSSCLSSLLSPSRDKIFRSLELPHLIGLHSLSVLDVRDCNLFAIPGDIGCLSSLSELILSRNNFSCLPSSLSQLSKLTFLDLDDCERLQVLPELPSSIYSLVADGCSSLEKLPSAKPLLYSSAGFSGCVKLVENLHVDYLVDILLQSPIQHPDSPPTFSAVLPGREIPNWFSDHQNMGDTVSIQLPSNWGEGVTGVAVCVVFKSEEGTRPSFSTLSSGADFLDRSTYYVFGFRNCRQFRSKEQHLWLGYLKFGCLEFYESARLGGFTKIEISFNSSPYTGSVILKCGARLVYHDG